MGCEKWKKYKETQGTQGKINSDNNYVVIIMIYTAQQTGFLIIDRVTPHLCQQFIQSLPRGKCRFSWNTSHWYPSFL